MTTPPIPTLQAFRSLPPDLRAGDSLAWNISLSEFPPASYNLNYVLVGVVNGTPTRITFNAGDIVDSATEYTVTLNSAETAAWTPGRFLWVAFVSEILSLTAGTTSGSTALGSPSTTTGIVTGMPVSGPGIPAGTTIVNTAGVLSLSQNATATGSGVTLTVTGNRTQVAQGTIKILPDVAGSTTPVDPRTQNEITLWAINQLIAGRSVTDVQMYEIGGRKLEKMTIKELMYFRGIVSGWVRKEKKARGERVRPNSVGITFSSGGSVNG